MRVIPEYELLLDSLQDAGIGDYLVSRSFKVFMTKHGYHGAWRETLEKIKNDRNHFTIGRDYKYYDSIDAVGLHLNALKNDKNYEPVLTIIMCEFIEWLDERKNFSELIEALILSGFSSQNIELVKASVELNSTKDVLPKPDSKLPIQDKKEQLSKPDSVFIVHGHNNETKLDVARTLEQLGVKAIILHEEPNEGQTIIEKLEKHSNVSFAIILLTGDDHGSKNGDPELAKRARQNVILELGYFLSKLGRKRVLPLYEKNVELPSDISGVLYTELDANGSWKFKMAKELKTVGFDIDMNKL